LLASVNVPFAAPAAVGSNSISSVAVWPALSVSGNEAPLIEKPAPDTVADEIVTAEPPVELSVRLWVDGEFTFTLPNATIAELTLSVPGAVRLIVADEEPEL
jgi:hypothetical protein